MVSEEFNGGSRDNDGTVRPRHTRYFPGGLWKMIMENALSRVFLGVHWIFDAFDFTENNGDLVPDLTDEQIGGVSLGLRIARDIFAFGNGKAPKMTPDGSAVPPIVTPPANSPMPAAVKQPTSVNGCADKQTPAMAPQADEKGMVQEAFPPGASQEVPSQEVQAPSEGQAQDVYPSGISEK
jgi:hypothetical protein